MKRLRLAVALASGAAVATGLLAASRPAAAYQCARVNNINQEASGPSLYWSNRKIAYSINQGLTRTLTADQARDTVQAAFNIWQNTTMGAGMSPDDCSLVAPVVSPYNDITFEYQGEVAQDFAGYNYLAPGKNRNMVIFRDDYWPYENTTYARAIALTTASMDTVSGKIFDSDIEINTANFKFYAGTNPVPADSTDLLNTLVHEVGHVLGLGHSADPNAVMYPQADRQEVKKRALSCDDVTLLSFRYPMGAPTNFCDYTNSAKTCGDCQAPTALTNGAKIVISRFSDGLVPGGCQAGGGAAGGAAAAAAALLWRTRRRPNIGSKGDLPR